MARSSLTKVTNDLQSDSGSVLLSMVLGEQLEFQIQLGFLAIATSDYTYEAVVIEADNVTPGTIPTAAKTGGVQTVLNVRVPTYRGVFDIGNVYVREDVVLYTDNKYYKLRSTVTGKTPGIDSVWELHNPATVYVQFPEWLGSNWSVQPLLNGVVYGLFELRVTEPEGSVFRRTWKPVRGLVSLDYSPTAIVS